jgi:hypothetical protein
MNAGGFLFPAREPILGFIRIWGQTMDARLSNPQPEPNRPILSEDDARQGVTGHHVRQVLIVSTGAAMILLLLVYLVYFWH